MNAIDMYRAARRHQQEYGDFEKAGQIYAELITAFPASEEAEMARVQLQILISTGRVLTVMAPSSPVSHQDDDPTTAWEPPDERESATGESRNGDTKIPVWLQNLPVEKLLSWVSVLRVRAAQNPRTAIIIALGLGGLGMVLFLNIGSPPPLNPDCIMNGYGQGTCTFSNPSSRANGACGSVIAWCGDILRSRKSSTMCSGDVAPRDSKQMTFSVAGFDRITPAYKDWRDECSFTWIPLTD
ncbi:MAG: tetratricopeptide repeat protein [Bradymonadaceae bacterium]